MSLACAAVLLAAAGAPPPAARLPGPQRHAVAFVNDPLSHGTLGDGLLSLNEVIRLHNRTLAWNQLSPAEQLQISGGSSNQDVAWADIDALAAPVIAVERDLDVVQDLPHGLQFVGVNGRPVLDFTGAGVTTGIVSVSNNVGFRTLALRGGQVGIDLTQTDSLYGNVIDDVHFTGQTTAGVRCTMASAGHQGRLLLQYCRFENMPVGVLLDDSGAGRTTVFYLGDSDMTGVGTGLEIRTGTGGSAVWLLERLDLEASVAGMRLSRPGGGTRAVRLELGLVRIAAAAPFEYQGAAGAPTALVLRMLELHGTGTGPALRIGPLGAEIAGDLDELSADGGLEVLAGGGSPLRILNARVRGGAVRLGSGGPGAFAVKNSRFDAAAVTTSGAVPLTFSGCCVVGGSLQGTAAAPLQLDGSFVGAAMGAQVASSAPLPAAQLGRCSIVPARPATGGAVDLRADLPPGFLGFWALGPTAAFPTFLGDAIHVYFDPAGAATAAGVYRLQQSLLFTVPAAPSLRGSDWIAQMLVVPDPGVAGPLLSLPPGVRFVIR